MAAPPIGSSTELLQEAQSFVSHMGIHQELCRELVSYAMKRDAQFCRLPEWIETMRDLRNSTYEWSELSDIGSFLKCDMISGKIASIRAVVSNFYGTPFDSRKSMSKTLSDANALIPTLLSIYRGPDALQVFDSLPSAHRDTAVSLLKRILSAISSEASPFRDMVASTILQLQRKEVDAALDVPDLTPQITIVDSTPLQTDKFSMVIVGRRLNHGAVMLKVLKSIKVTDSKTHRALQRDFKLRLSLAHPHLLPFLGICSTEFGLAMVSPYTTHGNASQYLSSRPDANAIAILAGAAQGLNYLHSYWPALTHGDVRGINILVSAKGDSLLADHGLYRLLSTAKGDYHAVRWAAPEIFCTEEELQNNISSPQEEMTHWWRDSTTDPSIPDGLLEVVTPMSDIWSFGMTMYELLTGRLPYHQHARDETVVLALRRNERPIPPTSSKDVRTEWQPELWSLMQECWRTDRRKRPQMEHVKKQLEIILSKSFVTLGCLQRTRGATVSHGPKPIPSSQSTSNQKGLSHQSSAPNIRTLSHQTSAPNIRALSPAAPSIASVPSIASAQARLQSTRSPIRSPTQLARINTLSSPISSLQSPTESAAGPLPSTLKVSSPKGLRRRVSAIFSGVRHSTSLRERRPSEIRTPVEPFMPSVIEVKTPPSVPPLPTEEIPKSPIARPSLPTSPEPDIFVPEIEHMSLTERRAYEHRHGLQRGTLQTGSGSTTPSGYRSPAAGSVTSLGLHRARSPTSPISAQSLRTSSSLNQLRLSPTDARQATASPTLSAGHTIQPISRHTQRPTPRIRTSGPYSVGSQTSPSTFSPSSAQTSNTDHAFNIIVEDVDETFTQDGINGRKSMTDQGDFPSNMSSESSSHSASDLMHEAFHQISISPAADGKFELPEDVSSPKSDPSASLVSLTAMSRTRQLSPADYAHGSKMIIGFYRSEESFLAASLELELESSLCGRGEQLTKATEATIRTLLELKEAHRALMRMFGPYTTVEDLNGFRQIFDMFEKRIGSFYVSYQEYVRTLGALEEAVADSQYSGSSFFMAPSMRETISTLLKHPFRQLDESFQLLKGLHSFLKPLLPSGETHSWAQTATNWEVLAVRTRLWTWQTTPCSNPLVSFKAQELLMDSVHDDKDGEARHLARLGIIDTETCLVRLMVQGQKVLRRHSWDDESTSNALMETVAKIAKLHQSLLDELHTHQRENHPRLPPVTSYYLRAMPQWGDTYTVYSRLVDFALQNLDLTKAIRELLVGPLVHIKEITKLFKHLFDLTPDHHFDIELITRLLPLLDDLVVIATKVVPDEEPLDKEIVALKKLLLWKDKAQELQAGLDSSGCTIMYSGNLHYPVDPNGTRKSIDDRSTTVQVFVALTNRCLIVAEARSRMGIKRYPVRVAIALHDLVVPDIEMARVSQQQIFLLDSVDGKKIAAPLQLLYREDGPRNLEPRTRGTSNVSLLGVRQDDGQRLLFPKDLVLLAATTGERTLWREQIQKAKSGEPVSQASAPVSKSMFRLTSLGHLPFIPSSTAQLHNRVNSVLICAEGEMGGAYLKDEDGPLTPVMLSSQVRQCCLLASLHTALFLVGKVLWAIRIEDIGAEETSPPVIVKSNVSLFRVGYYRGQLLLVTAVENGKSTTLKIYAGIIRSRSGLVSPTFFSKSHKLFKSICEQDIHGEVYDINVLEDGIFTMGVTGFQLITLETSSTCRVSALPAIKVGASSEAAQRCRTSKPLGVTKSGSDLLLCYDDFGVYVNTSGEILGRPIDWTLAKVSNVAFAAPYLFLFAENHIEVRLIESGRKLETIDGTGFRLVRGVDETRSISLYHTSLDPDGTSNLTTESVDQDSALLHLTMQAAGSDQECDLMELQMEVLDLSA